MNDQTRHLQKEKKTSQESILEMIFFFLISNYDCLETEYSTQELFLLLLVKFSVRCIFTFYPVQLSFVHK